MPQERRHLLHDARKLAIKLRKPREPSGELRKGLHLILGLQVRHMRTCRTTRFQEIGVSLVQADHENRDVALPQLLERLIQGVLREGVHAARQQQNRFLASHIFQLVRCFEDSVENIGLGKSGEIEMVDGIQDFVFVLREVHFRARLHVKSH
jgi:hypothetical protein